MKDLKITEAYPLSPKSYQHSHKALFFTSHNRDQKTSHMSTPCYSLKFFQKGFQQSDALFTTTNSNHYQQLGFLQNQTENSTQCQFLILSFPVCIFPTSCSPKRHFLQVTLKITHGMVRFFIATNLHNKRAQFLLLPETILICNSEFAAFTCCVQCTLGLVALKSI